MLIHDVAVNKIESNASQELADNFYRACAFCEKLVRVNTLNSQSCANLSGPRFYCPFCLRNQFNYRTSSNVLIYSFRAVLGYYYRRLYNARPNRLWFSQLEGYVERHAQIGLQNPALSYDPSTFLWFMDFNRIGKTRRKAPLKEVLSAVSLSFDALDVGANIKKNAAIEMWDRYQKAMVLFYRNRKRPKDKRMLICTFRGLVPHEDEDFFENTKNFNKAHMVIR